jgi:hypothetical protein
MAISIKISPFLRLCIGKEGKLPARKKLPTEATPKK